MKVANIRTNVVAADEDTIESADKPKAQKPSPRNATANVRKSSTVSPKYNPQNVAIVDVHNVVAVDIHNVISADMHDVPHANVHNTARVDVHNVPDVQNVAAAGVHKTATVDVHNLVPVDMHTIPSTTVATPTDVTQSSATTVQPSCTTTKLQQNVAKSHTVAVYDISSTKVQTTKGTEQNVAKVEKGGSNDDDVVIQGPILHNFDKAVQMPAESLR